MSEKNRIIPIMKYRKLSAVISALLLIASIGSLAVKGLNFGLDFTGGTVNEYHFSKPADIAQLRGQLKDAGFQGTVVNYGSQQDVLVRLQTDDKTAGQKLTELFQKLDSSVELKRADFVGPQVGEELRDDGGLALLAALLMVMAYVAFRFQFKFSIASVAALIHDVIIVLGLFSIFQWDFDLSVLAAVLAVIGYSLNDTIVVSDRIRENFLTSRETTDPEAVIDLSINQMFGRTIITSLTTFFVVLVLFLFGGEAIKGFSLALIIGIIVGTYSSIFVAANALLRMNVSRDDLVRIPKEDIEYDTP